MTSHDFGTWLIGMVVGGCGIMTLLALFGMMAWPKIQGPDRQEIEDRLKEMDVHCAGFSGKPVVFIDHTAPTYSAIGEA